MRKEKYKKLSLVAEFMFSSGKQFLAFIFGNIMRKTEQFGAVLYLWVQRSFHRTPFAEKCVLRKYYKSYMNFLNNFIDKINCNKVNNQGRVVAKLKVAYPFSLAAICFGLSELKTKKRRHFKLRSS